MAPLGRVWAETFCVRKVSPLHRRSELTLQPQKLKKPASLNGVFGGSGPFARLRVSALSRKVHGVEDKKKGPVTGAPAYR